MVFLRVEHLDQFIESKQLLHDISLTASLGQIVALLGPNGAGKTTLIKTIIGLISAPKHALKSEKNKIILHDQVINSWPIYKRVDAGLVYLPQSTSLFQQLTVQENLELVYEYQGYWQGKNREDFLKERDFWLGVTGLVATLPQKAMTLSGGQKRKLEVVRALLMHPRLIMLDEPFAGVDPKSIYELKSVFKDVAGKGIGILISDHHVDQLFSISDYVYVVMHGQVVTQGVTKDVLEHSYTKESYFGNQFYQEMSKKFL
jgi:lipopolysaccharide export system ATP-binding protein